MNVRRQITLYYINILLVGTWFTSGVTLFFSRRFLTDGGIGWVDAAAFGIGLLAEIPSGTIADVFGRRRTVMLGVAMMGVGFAIWGLAVSGWMVFVGIGLYSVGAALQSGADEAMLYDFLKANGHEDLWPRLSANAAILARLSYVVSIAVGGLLFVVYDRLPFLMRAVTFFLMLIPLIQLAVVDQFQEIRSGETTFRTYLHDLRHGMQALFQAEAIWLVPLYLMVQGITYTAFTAGILRPLLYEKSGLNVAYHSFAISAALILTVLTMFVLRRAVTRKSSVAVIYGFAAICALGFAANVGSAPLVIALIGLTLVQVASYSLMPLLSTALNSAVSSRYRATTLSTASVLQGVVYVGLAPVVGALSTQGHINEVAIGATLVVAGGVGLSLVLRYLSRRPLASSG